MRSKNTTSTPNAGPIEILWGVAAIAAVIGRSERQTHYLLSLGELPAKKVGGHWCANRRDLDAFFSMTGTEAA